MKQTRSKRGRTYVCRKCTQSDFRSLMDFTKHLRKCAGAVMPNAYVDSLVKGQTAARNGMKAELLRLRSLGVEVRDLADKLLKRTK